MATRSKTVEFGGLDIICNTIAVGATKPGQAGTVLSGSEIVVLDSVTAGSVTASKALVVDSSRDLTGTTAATAIRNLRVTNLDAGISGTAGSVDVFPTTAATGKLTLVAASNAGDTTTTITNASQAGAVTYTIPDAGAAASFVLSTGTSTATTATSTELNLVAGATSTPTASKAVIATASGWAANRRPVIEDGAAVVLGAVDSGALCIFDKIDGALFTLPTPAIGLWYEFIVVASVTSNSMKVITNTGTVFIKGSVDMVDTDTTFTHTNQDADGTGHVAVTMASASTNSTGGIKGTRFTLVCRDSTHWTIHGQINHAGTVATPFTNS